MIVKERLSQLIFERTNVFPHARFVVYILALGGLVAIFLFSVLLYGIYFGMTLPDSPDLESDAYVESMQRKR